MSFVSVVRLYYDGFKADSATNGPSEINPKILNYNENDIHYINIYIYIMENTYRNVLKKLIHFAYYKYLLNMYLHL